ncbi:MAG TPA: hypothetical protein VEX35_10555 [Allosphingosinicella sp.]|nr:hypothetical protein [Allosphingosinicella sp.]
MMRGLGIAAAALMLATPAAAQSDRDLLRTIRSFGNGAAGQDVGRGTPVDKVIVLGRRSGEIVVTAMGGALPDQWPDAAAGTFAILRTRASTPGGNSAPAPADIAYVRRTGHRVFIVGEWARPPVIWEVARRGSEVRVRAIDAEARPGPWRTAAP